MTDGQPPSRPSIDTAQSLGQLYDHHIKVLNESYLAFFQERKKIEEQYVAALMKLHRKARSADHILDDRAEQSTTRAAWNEITDNVEREASIRTAYHENLSVNVIDPLITFRETQDRIRKRIKEDLKEAISAHAEYAENTLPRLKRAYIKKCQEVDEYRSAPITSPISPAEDTHHTRGIQRHNTITSPRPVVTGPQPLRPLDRRPSSGGGGGSSARARSPSSAASNTLQDLAHQGKKQLNQLMTLLDKGQNQLKDRESSRADNALRSVRAKRESEEADKEYRRGVHFLETLRIRRIKLVESSLKSLETFVHEASETVKNVLMVYTDNTTAASATASQLCEHCRRMVEKVSPQKDSSAFAATFPRILATATPKPVYYYNYTVGECKDLIFGVSIVDYATARGLPEGEIPKIVKMCISDIETRGLDAEGIYRVSGRHAAVQELQHKIERNEAAFVFNHTTDDVYSVSSLLKLYLRELPEPVFKFPLQERIQHTEDFDDHASNDFSLLRSKIRRLPPVHQATLKAIVEHLARIASRAEKNKMDPKNLAIVFGSVIFGEDDAPKGGDLLALQSWKDTLMEDLITHAHVLFQATSSPPLPAAPLGEQPGPVAFGSAHTKVTNLMPPPPSPRRLPDNIMPITPRASTDSQRPQIQLSDNGLPPLPPRPPLLSPQDFTPQLPARPANSIHPSLRAGPSSSPARQPGTIRSAQLFDDQVRVTRLAPQLPPITADTTITPPASLSAPSTLGNISTSSIETSASQEPQPSPMKRDFSHPPAEPAQRSPARSDFIPIPSPAPSPTKRDFEAIPPPPPLPASPRLPAPPLPPPPVVTEGARKGSGQDAISPASTDTYESALSSTASAAAFASATPSPSSSSSGHSRKGSAFNGRGTPDLGPGVHLKRHGRGSSQ